MTQTDPPDGLYPPSDSKTMSTPERRVRLAKRLAAYSAMAGAVVGVEESQAGVVVFNNINATVGFNEAVFVDIDGMTTSTATVSQYGYPSAPAGAEFGLFNEAYTFNTNNDHWSPKAVVPYGSAVGRYNQTGGYYGYGSYAVRQKASQNVGPSQPFISYYGYGGGALFHNDVYSGTNYVVRNDVSEPWSAGDSGFVGFRIDLGGGDFQYGWAQLRIEDTYQGDVTILSAAIETDANVPIHIIPEPTSLAALALGAAGITAMRRRRETEAE